VSVHPADRRSWSDVETLFGRAGASNGCWCQYWLLGAEYHRHDRGQNKAALRRQVGAGSAGLLARVGDVPVGWARFTPRPELRWLTARFSGYPFSKDVPWALSCFFVPGRHRDKGVMRSFIDFAADWARDSSVAVEAYPVDPAAASATRNRFTGVLPVFLEAGFVEVGRLAPDRAVVRLDP
jgi:hypothetical protein